MKPMTTGYGDEPNVTASEDQRLSKAPNTITLPNPFTLLTSAGRIHESRQRDVGKRINLRLHHDPTQRLKITHRNMVDVPGSPQDKNSRYPPSAQQLDILM